MAEATGNVIGNEMADEITKVSRTWPHNSSGTVRNETENIEHDKELLKERYVSRKKKANY